MNNIPADALNQIKLNQARRRGTVPLEPCACCGELCTFDGGIVWKRGKGAMHEACYDVWQEGLAGV